MSTMFANVAATDATAMALKPLTEVADILDGKRIPVNAREREKRSGRVPYYGATGQVGWIDDFLFDEELVLLGEDGAPFLEPHKPKAYVIRGKAWVNNHAHVLRARAVPTSWLAHYLNVVGYDGLVTGTTRLKLTQAAMRQIRVPVAPWHVMEQRVAEIEKQFSRLDEAVANLKRVKANLDRYLAATLCEAVSGRWAGTEADWRPVPLREVADVQLGQQRAPVHAADENPVPYVRAANVTWRGFDLCDVKSMGFPNVARYRLAYGDILLAEASGSANEVGKPAVWRDEIPGACYQKTLIRVRCMPDRLNFEFAYYFFLHTALSGQFARLAPGVGILHLTAERMLVWPMVAPPLRIQASVVAEVDRRLSIVREVEAETDANLKRAQALRQAVLVRAFSGTSLDRERRPASRTMATAGAA